MPMSMSVIASRIALIRKISAHDDEAVHNKQDALYLYFTKCVRDASHLPQYLREDAKLVASVDNIEFSR